MSQEKFFAELIELSRRFDSLKPELEVTVRDPELDVEGHVVVWNTGISAGGPLDRCGKGGTRITPTLDLDEVRMLSRIMALKNAAAGLPMGGAKSGLRADPDVAGFEKRYRKFVSLCKPFLFENGGIFGGFGFDIGAREVHPLWACDELASTRSFTGKPLPMGGTDYDREGIAGLGVVEAAVALLECCGESPKSSTYAVQGIGALGAAVVKYFSERGAVLSVISDPRIGGTFFFAEGAPKHILKSIGDQDFDQTNQALQEFGKPGHLDEVLYANVDILVPSAVQEVIHTDNVDRIQARYLVEGANNPCTKESRAALHRRAVRVIPDFIANPGGIIAAFVELTSTLTPEENAETRGNVTRAKEMTREKISANVRKMHSLCEDLEIEPVDAGRYLALQNIFSHQRSANIPIG